MLDGEKIEPAPNTPVAALAHGFEIGAAQVRRFNADFDDALARRALKRRSRQRLAAASRTAHVRDYTHGDSLGPEEYEPGLKMARARRR
jgi:hypothetical protein